jgi:hypothetical protein
MSATQQLTTYYLLALAVLSLLAILLYLKTADSPKRRVEFQTALLIQLLGTVAFGAVVAHSLYTIQHSQQEEEKQEQDVKMAAENKKRVLGFIRDELSYNLAALNSREEVFDANKAQFKSEFWKIAGLSGDLKWIDDAPLLNTISQAYFDLGISAAWETRYIDAAFGPSTGKFLPLESGLMALPNFIAPFVTKSYKAAKVSVSAALDRLKSN